MTRRTKKKVTKDDSRRCKFTPWDSDRARLGSASSLDVLMAWLTKPGNADRWRQEKPAMCREIVNALEKNGILHREQRDVRAKIGILEKKFASASAHLSLKGQTDAFQRGEVDQEFVVEVLKLCPLYRELVPVFGRIVTVKETQLTLKDVANEMVTATASTVDKSNETASLPPAIVAVTGWSNSVAGKWKESVERNRRNVDAQEIQDENREKVVEKAQDGVNEGQVGDASDGEKNEEEEKKQNRTIDNGADATNAVDEIASAEAENEGQGVVATEKDKGKEIEAVAMEDESSGADGKDEIGEAGQHHHVVVNEVEEGVVADVEDHDDKQSIDDDDGNDKVLEKAQVVGKSAVDSSEEEERRHVNTHPKVSRILQYLKRQLNESEESSSEEEDSEEETRVREEEQDDDSDGEEQIQLAQPDEVGEGDEDEDEEEIAELIEVDEDEIAELIEVDEDDEDIAELNEVNEEGNKEVEADENDKNEVEEMEETEEEEVEKEPELGGAKEEKTESSSSESESEGDDNEEEVSPTQLKVASDVEEESDHGSQHDEGDDDGDLEEDGQQSADQQQLIRKRSSSCDSFSPSNKRARESSNVTRDLEREAFIERTKQERDQRDELFQLERAKLACELQAKQVQLAMERSLACKKLLGAGVDPAEVDRVLPLSKAGQ